MVIVVGTYVRPRTVSASVRRGGFNCVNSSVIVDNTRLLGERVLDALVLGDDIGNSNPLGSTNTLDRERSPGRPT